MLRFIRTTEGKTYAIQLWRLVVYVDRPMYHHTRSAGIMINVGRRRVLAPHLFWRFCFAGPGAR